MSADSLNCILHLVEAPIDTMFQSIVNKVQSQYSSEQNHRPFSRVKHVFFLQNPAVEGNMQMTARGAESASDALIPGQTYLSANLFIGARRSTAGSALIHQTSVHIFWPKPTDSACSQE